MLQLKTKNHQHQKQISKSNAIKTLIQKFKTKIQYFESQKYKKELIKKHLLIFHAIKRNRDLLKANALENENKNVDSDQSSVEEDKMNLYAENKKLSIIVDKQRKQIKDHLEQIDQFKVTQRKNKMLKFDKKKLRKKIKESRKYW